MVTSPLLTTIFPFLQPASPTTTHTVAKQPASEAVSARSRLHAHGNNVKYEVTIIRWTEFLHTGERAGTGVYLDFGEIEGDAEDEVTAVAGGCDMDWDGQDFDDDAWDWTQEEEEVWAPERVERRDDWEGVDIWRTRLGAG